MRKKRLSKITDVIVAPRYFTVPTTDTLTLGQATAFLTRAAGYVVTCEEVGRTAILKYDIMDGRLYLASIPGEVKA